MEFSGNPFVWRANRGIPRLVTTRTNVEHTESKQQWARRRLQELEKEESCGYIFKSGSPSSGIERGKVYDRNGMPAKVGVRVFGRIFMEQPPGDLSGTPEKEREGNGDLCGTNETPPILVFSRPVPTREKDSCQ